MEQINLIRQLADWGCDTQSALERMLADEDFYRECLVSFCQDKGFETLVSRLEHGDAHGAFESAHMLKGVAANLGLTPLYEPLCGMVKALRAGRLDGMSELCQTILKQREELRRYISA